MSAVPFADLLHESKRHREQHGCSAYPYDKGSLLSVITAALKPRKIIEVGTAIGYTSVCMASAAVEAAIDTIDSDPEYIDLASIQFEKYGFNGRITAHCGEADEVLPKLEGATYDLAIFDGFAPTNSILGELQRLLRTGGTLVCANLMLGGDSDQFLADEGAWIIHSFGETAIAVKR